MIPARRTALHLSLALLSCFVVARFDIGVEPVDEDRFMTTRMSEVELELPSEEDSFVFAVFGDRTGGVPEGILVLKEAVAEVNLLHPDLVMTVGDLIQGYSLTPPWLVQMVEFKSVMGKLSCPWFPVAGNHDTYWRGPEGVAPPAGQHDANYEQHFGPLWYAFEHKGSWFVVLYTDEGNPETGEKTFHKPDCQRMSPEQFAFLDEALMRAEGAPHVFVFLHHPRWLKGGYGDDWDRVHERLVEAGNVTAVFAGHIHHMRYDGLRDGIEYHTLATVGGGQSGVVPKAGYLHQYDFVTVRDEGIAVTSYPVGSAFDPRAITGELADESRLVARELWPRFDGAGEVQADGSVIGDVVVRIQNPATRAVEVQLAPESADSRWRLIPEHQHARIEPGAATSFQITMERIASPLDASWRAPELVLDCDYLGEGLRVPLPVRRFDLPVDARSLPAPDRPATEAALQLDGAGTHLRVRSADLALADGPFTLECWVAAEEYRSRQGLVCKTENSEYGLFANDGRPAFLVHLDGNYSEAAAGEPVLTPGSWHHVAGVFDGVELRLYVDGTEVASQEASGARTPNDLPLIIGGDVNASGGAASSLKGSIDELRLSVGARYTAEHFTPERRFERDADTVLLLHMDAIQGPWVYDDSGDGSPADVRGGAWIAPVASD